MKLFCRSSLRLKTVLHPSRLWTGRLYRRPKCFSFYYVYILERPLNATCFCVVCLHAARAFSLLRCALPGGFLVITVLATTLFVGSSHLHVLKSRKRKRYSSTSFSHRRKTYHKTIAKHTHLKKEKKERLSFGLTTP